MMEIPEGKKKKLFPLIAAFLIVLSLYFAVKFLAELRDYRFSGSADASTITLSGHGEVDAPPDIASVSFTVESTETTQSAASDDVNKKVAKILDFISSSGIDQKDVKTENYSSYPKYSNPEICPLYAVQGETVPTCRPGNSKIIGYTVSENITVKVRKIDDASKVIDGINQIGVTNMSGPNFTIDDPEALKDQARQKAIDDAETKAKELAKELHVRLVKITSFSESGNYPGPIMYAAKDMAVGASAESTPSQLPQGQNTITSDVTITYSIR
ncbi:MAG TPA: SIMPL domain-containing protein [Candidatus Paceibacterota bacterium]|jgi:uncharacterized protein YggE|nr:SIMPL domain-containing protein [Candidatus Paceibacterota bacterium]